MSRGPSGLLTVRRRAHARFAEAAPRAAKVDRWDEGLGDLVMGYEDLPPGGVIPPHWHLLADEIIFVHRGSGVAWLGGREAAFGPGTTVYMPWRAT